MEAIAPTILQMLIQLLELPILVGVEALLTTKDKLPEMVTQDLQAR